MIINRIDPMSLARLSGLLYAVMRLVLGGIISLVALAGGFASDTKALRRLVLIGVGAVVVLPICYGLLGFVGTLIAGWLFNVVAGIVRVIVVETS